VDAQADSFHSILLSDSSPIHRPHYTASLGEKGKQKGWRVMYQ
jgi:hypothetical protein